MIYITEREEIRKIYSWHITGIWNALVEISEKYGFYFRFEKHNRGYVQLGGSSKIVTFIVWFGSTQGRRSYLKKQVKAIQVYAIQ